MLELFHKYFYGQEFHLDTDHSNLTWFFTSKNLEDQTDHWVQCFQKYNFTSKDQQGGSTPSQMQSSENNAVRHVLTLRILKDSQAT
jgi:hypothetical protein